MNKQPVNTIKVEAGKILVSPLTGVNTAGATTANQIKTLYDMYNESFIEVKNPEDILTKLNHGQLYQFLKDKVDGYYSAPDGMFMEVKEACSDDGNECGTKCYECPFNSKQVALITFEAVEEKTASKCLNELVESINLPVEGKPEAVPDFYTESKLRPEYVRLSKYFTTESHPEIWSDGYVKGAGKIWNDLQEEIARLKKEVSDSDAEINMFIGTLKQADEEIARLKDALARLEKVVDWMKVPQPRSESESFYEALENYNELRRKINL